MDIEPFALDLVRPLETASGTIAQREGFLVTVERNRVVGVGEATPLPGWTESLEDCRSELERAATVTTHNGIDAALDGVTAPAARHGLSLALADARAKREDVPLYRSLGGDGQTASIPVNATIGDGSTTETVAACEAAVERGFECLKCKVGSQSVRADAERLRAVRDAVGPTIELRADANAAWSRERAERALAAFADAAVRYVEQPLSADDIEGHALLRGGAVGVALDETLTEASFETILAADAADVVVLKPMALGGPDRARDVAVTAREAGVTPVVTSTIDGAFARSAAVHVAASVPAVDACGLATAEWLAEDLVTPDPVPVTDGLISIPQGKGNITGEE